MPQIKREIIMNNFEERMQMAKTTFVTRWKTDTRLVASIRVIEKASSYIGNTPLHKNDTMVM